MLRRLTAWIVESCLLLSLGVAASLMALATDRETLSAWGADVRPRPGEDVRPGLLGTEAPAAARAEDGDESAVYRPAPEMTWLPAGRVTLIVHGVNDDDKDWSLRIRNALMQSHYGDSRQEVHLFRWTQPDGDVPSLAHARNRLSAIEARYPNDPDAEAGYQIEEARRLKDFLAGARALTNSTAWTAGSTWSPTARARSSP